MSAPCRTLIKIREAIATKQSFQKLSPGFSGCRAACTDTQSHWCSDYYCHPIIVIVMPIQLPFCKFLEGRDRVSNCFSWIHAFLLPFSHPTHIYWVQPSPGLPLLWEPRKCIASCVSPTAQRCSGCQPSCTVPRTKPQIGLRLHHLQQPEGQKAAGDRFCQHLYFIQTSIVCLCLFYNNNKKNLIKSTF